MSDKTQRRRKSLLATLMFWPVSTVSKLQNEMETVHGVVCSADLIRSDLTWLAEMELVKFVGMDAQITERGRDVATGRAHYPGEA